MKDIPDGNNPQDATNGENGNNENGESAATEDAAPKPPLKKHFSILHERKPSSIDSDQEGSPVHVVARVRPLNPQELARKDTNAVEFAGNGGVFVESHGAQKKKSFAFNAVFETECSQKEVFDNCDIQRLLDMALGGYACTAFAFGQTGSGKSYTMTGPVTPETTTKQENANSLRHPDNYGLIQFSFAYLIQQAFSKQESHYTMKASYMEIYNEQVQDLLNPYGYDIVQVRWSKSSGFYVENLFVREIDDLDELMDVLEDGMKNRSVAAHNMNEHSSRSHSILTVHVDSDSIEDGISVTKHGKISFVDLAGSEKVKETGSTGDTLTEATNINRSLLTLGNCISALSDSKKRTGHIPFRDSKLTKLLADSLGGSGATLMVACVSPSSHNVSETLNTLRYAKRAKKIKNKPVVRMDPREELILKLQREMNLIKQENQFLRSQLQFPRREKPRYPHPGDMAAGDVQHMQEFLPQVNQVPSKPNERPATENSLYGMLQEYMVENEALRNENESLMTQHSHDERDYRIISRENDRLHEKLEGLQRLVLASPMVKNGYSRTTSGHSYLSLHSYDSSLTPISQTFQHHHPHQAVFGPNGVNYPNYAINVHQHPQQQQRRPLPLYPQHQHPSQSVPAWDLGPNENGELPPLKRSPPPQKIHPGYGKNPGIVQNDSSQSKWEKGRSYAKQLQDKKAWHRVTNPRPNNNEATKRPKQRNDVMSDFPLRDLSPPKHQELLHGQVPRDPSPQRGFPQNGLHNSLNPMMLQRSSPMHPRRERAIQNQGALPRDAYKARDLSPRSSMTKELSATSLRRMNNKMRREMRALDDQIHYEQIKHQAS